MPENNKLKEKMLQELSSLGNKESVDNNALREKMRTELSQLGGKKKDSASGDLNSLSKNNMTDGSSPSDLQDINPQKIADNLVEEFYFKAGVEPVHKKMGALQSMVDEGADPIQSATELGLDYETESQGEETIFRPKYTSDQQQILNDAQAYIEQNFPEAIRKRIDANIEVLTQKYQNSDKTREDFDNYRDAIADHMRVRGKYIGSLGADIPDEELRDDLEAITNYSTAAWEDAQKDGSSRYAIGGFGLLSTPTSVKVDYATPYEKDLEQARKEQAMNRRIFTTDIFSSEYWEDNDEVKQLQYDHELTMISRRFAQDTQMLLDKLDKGFGGQALAKGFTDYITKIPKVMQELGERDSFRKFQDKLANIAAGDSSINDLTDNEFMLLQSMRTSQELLRRNQDKIPIGVEAAEAIGQSIGFMVEMAATAGVGSGVGKAVGSQVMKLSAGRLAPTITTKLTSRAAEVITQKALQTTAMPSFTISVAEGMAQNQDFGNALVDGYLNTYTEVLSEGLFGSPVSKFAKGSAIRKFWSRSNSAFGKIKGLRSAVEATIEEGTEEYFSAVASAWRSGDHVYDLEEVGNFMKDTRQQSVIWLATGVMAGGGAAVNMRAQNKLKRRFRMMGEALGPIKEDIDAILQDENINFNDLTEDLENTVLDYAHAKGLDVDYALETSEKAKRYAQGYYQMLSWDLEPLKERELPVDNETTTEQSEDADSKDEVLVKGENYSIKKPAGRQSILVFGDKASQAINKMISGEALIPDELNLIVSAIEEAKGSVKNKKTLSTLNEFLKDAEDLKGDLISRNEAIKTVNDRPMVNRRVKKAPIEPIDGANQTVYDVAIGPNMAGSVQETITKDGKTYQAFDPMNNKIGDFKSGDDAVSAIRENNKKQLGVVQDTGTNRAAKTQGFFSDVVNGVSQKYQPSKEWEPIMKFSAEEEQVKENYDKYKGKFNDHIATSIPGFREVQIKVLNALKTIFGTTQESLVYDIGGSEGGFAKTLSEQTQGRIKTINLDPNQDMQHVHESTPVEGSEFVREAFGSGFTLNGEFIPKHTPRKKADVVHESMTFQFISDERQGFVDEVADNYLKPNGLFVTEEKLNPKSEAQWRANEEKKDSEYKSQYYSEEQLKDKSESVLTGMRKNQASYSQYKRMLEEKFDFVEEYWDGGNFKGLVASNDKAKVDAFLSAVGNTDTIFSEKNIKPKKAPKKPSQSPEQAKVRKPKYVNVNEMQALKDQLKFENRAAREATLDYKQKLKDLAATVKEFVKKGKISSRQAAAVINKMAKTNLANPVMQERFLAYADKVFTKADNIEAIKTADRVRSKVKKAMKGNKDADVKSIAGSFLGIDSRLVEDLDEYIDMGNEIISGLKSSRRSGTEVNFKSPMNNKEVLFWVDSELERQEPIKEARNAEIDIAIFGMDPMTKEELESISKEKAAALKENIQENMNSAKAVVRGILKTGKDPLTGENVDLDENQRQVIRDFLDIDIELMSTREAIKAVDALRNFAVNYTTNGMAASGKYYRGRKMSEKISKQLKAFKFFSPIAPNWMARHIASIPLFFENIMRGRDNSTRLMEALGLRDYIVGKSRAHNAVNKINEAYHDRFNKAKPRGEEFGRRRNVIERGMYGYVTRAMPDNQEAMEKEFAIRKQRIFDSIDRLSTGTRHQRKLSEAYQEVYDSILANSETVADVESKVAKENKEAVQWWRDRWSELRPELERINRDVYNKAFNPEVNYLPDTYRKVEGKDREMTLDENLQMSSLDMALQDIFDRESSVLMEKRKFKDLPDDKYVSLDFDRNMHATMQAAALDVETAATTRQIEGFVNSPSFKKIFPNAETRGIVMARINGVINNARGRIDYGDKQTAALERAMSHVAQFAAARALGSVTMGIKQTIPVALNTLINARGLNLRAMTSKEINKFIDESGYAIASRGSEQIGEVVPLEKLKSEQWGGVSDFTGKLEKVSNVWIEKFLVKPDVAIARASWWTYYTHDLSRRGVNINKLDLSTHKIDKQAADYAQDMVDRQQNVSDADLLGEFLRTRNPFPAMMRKMLFPFANFMLNQKTRMYTDIGVLQSRASSIEDKYTAMQSLTGLVAEQVAFHGLSMGLRLLMFELAGKILGYREPEDAFAERLNRYVSQTSSYLISDLVSPLPVLDDIFIELTRGLLNTFGDNLPEWAELPSRNYVQVTDKWGTYGVGVDVVRTWEKLAGLAFGDSYKSEYMGQTTKRYLRDEDQETAKGMFYAYTLYMMGLLPAETAGTVRRMKQMLDDRSVTESKYNKFKEDMYKFRGGREPAGTQIRERNIDKEFNVTTRSREQAGDERQGDGSRPRY